VEHNRPHPNDHHSHCHSHNASGQECTCVSENYSFVIFPSMKCLAHHKPLWTYFITISIWHWILIPSSHGWSPKKHSLQNGIMVLGYTVIITQDNLLVVLAFEVCGVAGVEIRWTARRRFVLSIWTVMISITQPWFGYAAAWLTPVK
jgi:hypothetical protein